jgi:hypothetical protein
MGGPRDPQRGFSKGVHDYYAHYADNADAKIAALFAVNLAVAGLALGAASDHSLAQALLWVAIGVHAVAGGYLGYGIYPRVGGPGVDVLFWERVRRYRSAEEYQDDVLVMTQDDVEGTYAMNNYFVADVLHRKFQSIRVALWLTATALVLDALAVMVV